MTENESDIPELTGAPLGTTGMELREAREAKGWDVNSLSESLHLRPAVIIAIEEGDYREVPELFLKGYVRSYGRLVGLEGDRLIRQLESELQPLRQEEAERHVESPIFHIEVKKRKKRRIAFWVLWGLVLAIVAVGLIRFQTAGIGLGFSTDSGSDAGAETAPPTLEQFVESVPEQDAAGDTNTVEPLTETASDAVSAEGGQAPGSAETANTAPEAEEATPSAAAENAQDTLTDEPASTPVGDADSSTVAAASTAADAAEAAPASLASFTLAFDADCWLEVRNGDGERIYAGLQSAGDQLVRSASPPVSFVIGDIEGIDSFIFNGETIEISDYPSRNGRSEITLSMNSGN